MGEKLQFLGKPRQVAASNEAMVGWKEMDNATGELILGQITGVRGRRITLGFKEYALSLSPAYERYFNEVMDEVRAVESRVVLLVGRDDKVYGLSAVEENGSGSLELRQIFGKAPKMDRVGEEALHEALHELEVAEA